MHPDLDSAVILFQPCGLLPNFFKLHPDGVIQHLTSGMCIQRSVKLDPSSIKHGEALKLNYPCTLYRPNYRTPYALQFEITPGGSLREIKSQKCISSNKGQRNMQLTFSEICDTDDTKIGFIGWYILQ